jgi:5'-3' exonuclease
MGIKGFRSWFESQFPHAILALPSEGSNESFDHVLVDVNQLLHVCVRKSRSDGHGLTLLMKELDNVVRMATPTQSLVLAMDGPPSAAKLATQRRRRYSTIAKAEWKLQHLVRLSGVKVGRIKPQTLARKKRRAASELRTLCLTPGTDFMHKAESAILYWAWQRLSSATSTLSKANVRVFLSPSTVPGEGEVKLLEWIYSKQRKGGSIAILGGDSDLVLEGLVIPPASTHNVFVLLPDGSKRYLSVSLWETTRTLRRLLSHLTPTNMMKIRTDLVLLLILNGNDYLPKLRGSNGFNKLFHSYLRLQREWNAAGRATQAYLVDPDTLEFNLPFCLVYFQYLVR